MGLIKEAILTGRYPGKIAKPLTRNKLSNDIINDDRDQELVREERMEQLNKHR